MNVFSVFHDDDDDSNAEILPWFLLCLQLLADLALQEVLGHLGGPCHRWVQSPQFFPGIRDN